MRSTGLPDRHVAAACVTLCGPTAERTMNPAAMTPDLTAASRRARLRQDRCAPLRGGLRPVLTQSLLGALIAHGPGRKAAPHAELKASLGLPTGPRLKNGKTPLSRTEKHRSSRTNGRFYPRQTARRQKAPTISNGPFSAKRTAIVVHLRRRWRIALPPTGPQSQRRGTCVNDGRSRPPMVDLWRLHQVVQTVVAVALDVTSKFGQPDPVAREPERRNVAAVMREPGRQQLTPRGL